VLLFKKRFLDAIRTGRKTQTIRLWPYRRMRAGQRSFIPGAGYIEVLSVEPVEIAELTDQDAIPDGFDSAAALRAELTQLYSDASGEDQQAYRLRFRLLTEAEQLVARSERKSRRR
jgi:hypothetical protein